MYDPDNSDLTFTADGSRLLSESSLMAPESSSSHHASTSDDLSLSELSIHDRDTVLNRPFSLLSRPEPTTPRQQASGSHSDNERVNEEEVNGPTEKQSEKAREEKLQSDIFVLKKLNASFAAFNEALDATGGINNKIEKQLAQTDALLNKYVEILYRSEDAARLIFDEDWEGAEADEELLEQERQEALEQARREEEERRLAIQREKERQEREEREQQEKEAQAQLEREEREKRAPKGGSRGISRRGVSTRGTARGTAGSTNSRPSISDSTSRIRPPSTGLPTRKPTGSRGMPPGGSARGIRKT